MAKAHLKLGMKRFSKHFKHALDGNQAGRRMRLGRGEKEKQMFLRSRKAMAAATLFLVLPFSSSAFVPRKMASAPQAVEFSLRSIDGQNISSQSLRGEVAVLAFGA